MIEQNALQKPNYIVGIGASAGGLEALETFFDYMQPDTGLAFVIVQHLSPDFKSMMNELLKRHTKMKIERVEHKILVRPNTIYLIPASKDMILSGNKLLLIERNPDRNLNFPIDIFFQSLAKEAKERAIAVILSGTGSDGSRGVVDIHKEGGLVLIQDKNSAQFDGMPHNAIETGIADIITEPHHMPDEILTYIANLDSHMESSPDLPADPAPENELETIFSMLEERFQVDFKKYKPNTILRRIERRITLAGSRDIKSYLIRLKNTPTELDTLYRDLLIEVTQFFRNPEAFSALKEIVIPELVELAISGGEIRVWVPGCATGEEAYSLAILFDEYLEEHHIQLTRNFFATDVHQQSLRTAARGFYKGNSLTNLLPEQLARHFTPYQDGYMIDKKFREMVTFARHNVLENPPFTKQHLISCRNVLIYLEHAVQQQVLTHFHFGLVTGGFLLLGASDHIGRLGKEFDSLGRWRIFRKKRDVRLDDMKLPPPTPPKPLQTQPSLLGQLAPRLSDEWVESLLDEYVPDGLLLNEGYDVLYILGNGNEYLQPQKGPGTLNALKMLEGDLQITIRGGLIHVIKKNEVVTYKNIEAITQKGRVKVNVTIRPLKSSFHRINRFFVALEKVQIDQPEPSEKPVINPASSAQIISLRQELDYTKEHLKLTIEEVETTNEELQSTNEELTASNEEMQSTNEELQSVNEELYTVNAEQPA